jgi:hypothetical protein
MIIIGDFREQVMHVFYWLSSMRERLSLVWLFLCRDRVDPPIHLCQIFSESTWSRFSRIEAPTVHVQSISKRRQRVKSHSLLAGKSISHASIRRTPESSLERVNPQIPRLSEIWRGHRALPGLNLRDEVRMSGNFTSPDKNGIQPLGAFLVGLGFNFQVHLGY